MHTDKTYFTKCNSCNEQYKVDNDERNFIKHLRKNHITTKQINETRLNMYGSDISEGLETKSIKPESETDSDSNVETPKRKSCPVIESSSDSENDTHIQPPKKKKNRKGINNIW